MIVGGRSDGWAVVIRVNKAGGVINSVTAMAPAYVTWTKTWKYGIEKVLDYQPPTEDIAANKLLAPPLICSW